MTLGNRPTRPSFDKVLVSIVLPVYNEQQVLPKLVDAITHAMLSCNAQFEVVFVNDGSTDASPQILDDLAAADPQVRVVHFSRNFGHQAAVQAGLVYAAGDVIVLMDSDMQDAPEAISRFLAEWQAGYDVVYAVRTKRKEGLLKRTAFRAFYRLLAGISSIPIAMDAGIFGLIDRRVAREIIALAERDRYYPGLRNWVGFRQTGIEVERLARYDDQPRVSLAGLFRLAKTAVFSFSAVPIGAFYLIGGLGFAAFFGLSGVAVAMKLGGGAAVPPWLSLWMAASFFGGINSLGLAILGDYVTRIFDQVRARPMFIVDRTMNLDSPRREPARHPSVMEAKIDAVTSDECAAFQIDTNDSDVPALSDLPVAVSLADEDVASLGLLSQVSSLLDEAGPAAGGPSNPAPR